MKEKSSADRWPWLFVRASVRQGAPGRMTDDQAWYRAIRPEFRHAASARRLPQDALLAAILRDGPQSVRDGGKVRRDGGGGRSEGAQRLRRRPNIAGYSTCCRRERREGLRDCTGLDRDAGSALAEGVNGVGDGRENRNAARCRLCKCPQRLSREAGVNRCRCRRLREGTKGLPNGSDVDRYPARCLNEGTERRADGALIVDVAGEGDGTEAATMKETAPRDREGRRSTTSADRDRH